MSILFGDGIHDDTPAIQELLDSGKSEIRLPEPEKFYSICRPLKIHSRQSLILPRYATVRLADSSNCFMLENGDKVNGDHDFSVIGGIWDMNNLGQAPNPFFVPDPSLPDYIGFMFHIENAQSFRIAHITLKDPINFCITLDRAEFFTVEDITFDFNHGNPCAVNMDGVHLNGNCRHGLIRNLKGACYDDLVALNADEGSDGPISHIEIDGIFSEDCHSAVRLLSVKNAVEHIHISNVHGTFYQYCIGITKFYDGDASGYFDDLTLENIHAAKAPRHSFYMKDGLFVFPLIWFEGGVHVKRAAIRGLFRKETVCPIATVKLEQGARIENLHMTDVHVEATGEMIPPLFENDGTVDVLLAENITSSDERKLTGCGRIERKMTAEI